jgi:hypothetical protein
MTTGKVWRIGVQALPILSCLLCCANTIGPAICTLPIGEAKQKVLALPIGVASVPHFA